MHVHVDCKLARERLLAEVAENKPTADKTARRFRRDALGSAVNNRKHGNCPLWKLPQLASPMLCYSVSHVSTLLPHISFRLHFNSSVTLAVNTSVYTLIETPPPPFPSLIAPLLLTGSRLYARRNLWLSPWVRGWGRAGWKRRGHVPASTLKGEAQTGHFQFRSADIGSSAGGGASSGLLHVTVTSHMWCHASGLSTKASQVSAGVLSHIFYRSAAETAAESRAFQKQVLPTGFLIGSFPDGIKTPWKRGNLVWVAAGKG